jgi:ribosome-interacting GTPase 1
MVVRMLCDRCVPFMQMMDVRSGGDGEIALVAYPSLTRTQLLNELGS